MQHMPSYCIKPVTVQMRFIFCCTLNLLLLITTGTGAASFGGPPSSSLLLLLLSDKLMIVNVVVNGKLGSSIRCLYYKTTYVMGKQGILVLYIVKKSFLGE